MPARWIPLLYFAFAHLCLATALAALVFTPTSLVGFFYHPRMLAVVHLVTLGWISSSILGSIYIVGPLALRMPLPARGPDYAAFAGFAVGVVGMASHFWLDLPSGMAWGAGLTALAMSYVAARGIVNLWTAPVPLEARLPVALALLNVIVAALLGGLLAVDKVSPILRINHLDGVFAHAHLAALGWGTMMVVGAGYRILPMILPAAMPRGFWAYASGLLLEAGVIGLVWGFFAGGRGLAVAGSLAVAGIGSFLSRVVWMLRNRRPAPSELPRPDWSVVHAFQALAYLVAACGLGLYLAVAERSDTTLALASAYGVLGLLGFLSQIIVGVEGRLLPLFGWLWGFADREHKESPPSLYRAPSRALQGLTLVLWTSGVPLMAYGLAAERSGVVSAGAGALGVAVLTGSANAVVVLTRLWRQGR
jgi:hypothetical protein